MAVLQNYTLKELQDILSDGKPRRLLVQSPYHGLAPVDAFMHHGIRPCVEIETEHHGKVRCSFDHKLQVAWYYRGTDPAPAIEAQRKLLTITHGIPESALDFRTVSHADQRLVTLFIEAQYLLPGSKLAVQTTESNSIKEHFTDLTSVPHHEAEVTKITPLGDQEVFDLSMNHQHQEGHHSFLLHQSYGSSLISSNCVSCLGGQAV